MSVILALSLLAQDVAPERYLPPDAHAYIELSAPAGAEEIQRAWLRTIFTDSAAETIEERLIAWARELAEDAELPEGFWEQLSDLGHSFRALRLAVRMGADAERTEAFVVVEVADAQLADSLWTEHVAPNLAPAGEHGGFSLYRMTEENLGSGPDLRIARRGGLALAAIGEAALTGMIDRAGETSSQDITSHPRYQALERPSVQTVWGRWFLDLEAVVRMAASSGGRSSRWSFDTADASMGLRTLRGVSGWVGFDGSQVLTHERIEVDAGNPLLAVLRQPSTRQTLWAFVPESAVAAAVINIGDPQAVVDQIRGIAVRIAQVEDPQGAGEDPYQEFQREFRRELGAELNDVVGALGAEAGAFLAIDDFEAFTERARGVGILVKVRDPQAATTVLDQIRNRAAEEGNITFEASQYRGASLWVADTEGGDRDLQGLGYATLGDVVILGSGSGTLRAAIDARVDGHPLYSPPEGDGPSKALVVNRRALAELLPRIVAQADEVPELPFRPDEVRPGLDLVTIREDETGITIDNRGSGYLSASTFSLVGFLPFLLMSRSMPMPPMIVEPDNGGGTEGVPDYAPPVIEVPASDPAALPADPAEAERVLVSLAEDLGAEDPGRREEATDRMARIGRPAIPHLARVYRQAGDPEARARAEGLLLRLHAYDELPELLDPMVEGFVTRLQRVTEAGNQLHYWWVEENYPGAWGMEPSFNRWYLQEAVVLMNPEGVRRVVARLGNGSLTEPVRQNLAGFLMLYDSGAAGEALLRAGEHESDHLAQLFLRVASGWVDSPDARGRVIEGLSSTDRNVQRASFLAAERSAHPDVVDALFEAARYRDAETRFNACYTLRVLTRGEVDLSPFADPVAYKRELGRAAEWWRQHREGYRPERHAAHP